MVSNVIAILDGEAGSCGKGKVIGQIATDPSVNLGASIINCKPNAGHTFVDKNGKSTVFRNIPVSIVNSNTDLFIGPGSAIDMDIFADEYNRVKDLLNGRKIYVHKMVPLIKERHKQYERDHIRSGSTFKGCGAVTMDKIMRYRRLQFFKDFKDALVCTSETEWLDRLASHLDNPNEHVILEGGQGCDLDMNHSDHYPNTTSSNVCAAQYLSDSGISPQRLLQTIMVIRPFPIRISNSTELGKTINSGNYGTARELTWSEINVASLLGHYPSMGLLNEYKKEYSIENIKKYFDNCPKVFIEQIFGKKQIDLNSVTLVQALELERLFYKTQGINCYESEFIELPTINYEIENLGGSILDQSEQTTVTKRERRIFDLDINKVINNCRINTPSSLYLNFFQHIDYSCKGKSCNYSEYDIERAPEEYLNWLEESTGVDISVLGTGARNNERILKKQLVLDTKNIPTD